MDLQIVATVLTGLSVLATGLGVAVALASHNRTARRDLEAQSLRLERRMDDGFARLDSRMDDGFARLDTKMDDGFARLDKKMDDGFARLDTKIDTGLAGVRSDVGDVRGYVHSLEQRFYDFLRPRPVTSTGTDDA